MIKKRLILMMVFILITVTICYGGLAEEENNEINNFETWYVNAEGGLNCRDKPSSGDDSTILKIYDKGTELYIIGIDATGKWWETWDGETQGWCYSTYLVSDKKQIGSIGVRQYIGNFKITGYTPSPSENGGYSVTAMGDNLWNSVGWAIAVDPKVIPLGTKIYIDGIGYRVARDTGGAIKGNKIDVLTSSNHESCAITGYYNVYLAE